MAEFWSDPARVAQARPKRPHATVAIDAETRGVRIRFLGAVTPEVLSRVRRRAEARAPGANSVIAEETTPWDLDELARAALRDREAALDVLVDALLEVRILDDVVAESSEWVSSEKGDSSALGHAPSESQLGLQEPIAHCMRSWKVSQYSGY